MNLHGEATKVTDPAYRPAHRPGGRTSPLVVLLGPTAVGKTEVGLELCERFGGEIVGADSRQIYRLMDIGTAKPTAAEQMRVPHHLIDIRDPDETLTVAQYQDLAYRSIDNIHRSGGVPFLVGGTALYLRAVVQGLRIPEVPPDPGLRAELDADLGREGVAALFQRLQKLDPKTASVIDGRNPRRVMRALEIVLITGRSKVEMEGSSPPPYNMLQIGLDRARDLLYDRADRRLESMIDKGFVQETERLLACGYSETLPSMTGLGYRELATYLRGNMTLREAIEKAKSETHRFVRRQYTAFRKMDGVCWSDMETETTPATIVKLVGEFLHRA